MVRNGNGSTLSSIVFEEYYEHRENGSKVTGRNRGRIDKGHFSNISVYLMEGLNFQNVYIT